MSTIATQTETDAAAKRLGTVHLNGSAEAPKGTPGADYKYAKFLPSYNKDTKLPPLEPFEHKDPGHDALAHPNPRSFLDGGNVTNLTPKFGSEVENVQLSELDAAAKR